MTRDQICNGLQEISDEAYSRWVHHQYTRDKLIVGVGTYVEEAIKFLKQQEPVEPIRQMEQTEWTVCGHCHKHLISKWVFCPYCGRAVKWDG